MFGCFGAWKGARTPRALHLDAVLAAHVVLLKARRTPSLSPLQAGFITGAAAAFAESPIDFYKSQIQVQIIRAKSDPAYKRECSPSGWVGWSGLRVHPSLAKMHAMLEPPHMTFPALELLAAGPSLTPTASIPPSLPGAAPYTSVLDCVKTTLRTSGARGPFQVGWVGTGMAQHAAR